MLHSKFYHVNNHLSARLLDGEEYLQCACSVDVVWVRLVKKVHPKRQQLPAHQSQKLLQLKSTTDANKQGGKYFCFESPAQHVFNLERLRGTAFEDWFPIVRDLFQQVLHLHNANLTHGNLFLENIFAQNYKYWWIGDFCRGCEVSREMDVLQLAGILVELLSNEKLPQQRTSMVLLNKLEHIVYLKTKRYVDAVKKMVQMCNNNSDAAADAALKYMVYDVFPNWTKEQRVFLLGPYQSGKTTVCNMLKHLYDKPYTEEGMKSNSGLIYFRIYRVCEHCSIQFDINDSCHCHHADSGQSNHWE